MRGKRIEVDRAFRATKGDGAEHLFDIFEHPRASCDWLPREFLRLVFLLGKSEGSGCAGAV